MPDLPRRGAPQGECQRASCDMRVITRIRVPLLSAIAVSFGVACAGDTKPAVVYDARSRDAGAIATAPPDSVVLASTQRVLRAFLDASRESTPDAGVLDTLSECGDGGRAYFPSTLLAGYTLLPFEFRGDTIVGRAEVVTVAEIDVDRRAKDRFIARERVRSDVLEWDIIPLDEGGWIVCNGLRFGAQSADSQTTWRPEGASYLSARRLADSIQAVRR